MTASPFDLTGRRVLVTGASGGIGRATALAAARLGARVLVGGRDRERLEETAALLPGDGHRISPFDLSQTDAVPAWMRAECEAWGPLDAVVHCAGLHVPRPIRSVDAAFFERMMNVNLLSALTLTRGFRQKGCNPGAGAMVFLSSLAALNGPPAHVVYAAAKGGLISAARGLAIELLRERIRVNALAPGIVDTEMTRRSRVTLTPEQFDALLATHPMGFGSPEDVANAAIFLISDASRWINGVVLPVDGGASIV